jgi:ATP-dependent exoDNAse (exonuclease V) beta subunit
MDMIDAINTQAVQSRYDTISSLTTIAAGCNNVTELINRINRIYSRSNTGICLSTIHKAKGLEANNVHIICRSVMPQKYAKTKSEIQQERNLIYVAITRAKHKLCYVSEKEFPPVRVLDNDSDELTEFKYIESMVCKLYNKEPYEPIANVDISKFRLNNATKVESIHKNDNKKTISQPNKNKRKLIDKLLNE